ncbi:MAG: hypothetical protein QF535_13110, partial [Anaerolineales bacterium]|nr:hypothetical protein [Anaerolineales bacterium]
DSGGGGTGANAVDNIVPTAWEEVDYGFATGISDVGAVSASKGVVTFGVKAPTAGTGLSVSYATRMGDGHNSDGATTGGNGSGISGVDVVLDFVDYDAAHFGLRWGIAGQMELHEITCRRNNTAMLDGQDRNQNASIASCQDGVKHNPYGGSMFYTMQLGPLHLGTQATFKNLATTKATAIMNTRSVVGGAALVFGDTLSLSYGYARDKYRYNDRNRHLAAQGTKCGDWESCVITGGDDHEYVTQKYHGWSAALNLGPVALKGTHNQVRATGQSAFTSIYALGDTHSEINLSIAF